MEGSRCKGLGILRGSLSWLLWFLVPSHSPAALYPHSPISPREAQIALPLPTIKTILTLTLSHPKEKKPPAPPTTLIHSTAWLPGGFWGQRSSTESELCLLLTLWRRTSYLTFVCRSSSVERNVDRTCIIVLWELNKLIHVEHSAWHVKSFNDH